MKTYSQQGQDTWLLSYLNNKRNGYFVEAGGGDGIRLSNTYLLEKDYDWSGICIEAYEPLFKKLKNNRSCECIHSLLDGSVSEQIYTPGIPPININNPQGYLGGIVSRETDNKRIFNGSVKMMTTTLQDILYNNNAPSYIDYLSLDVEGAETRILKKFPFSQYEFGVMHIERPTEELSNILIKNGYAVVGYNSHDVYFSLSNT